MKIEKDKCYKIETEYFIQWFRVREVKDAHTFICDKLTLWPLERNFGFLRDNRVQLKNLPPLKEVSEVEYWEKVGEYGVVNDM